MRQTTAGRLLKVWLWLVGGSQLTAVAFAFGPDAWLHGVHGWLGLGVFPAGAVAEYLARATSLLYALLGGFTVAMSLDLHRHRTLLAVYGVGMVVFGLAVAVVCVMAGMPAWWTLAEAGSTTAGGLVTLALWRAARPHPAS